MARILVIDDDVLVGSLLKEHLSSEGFSVQVVTLGEEGLLAATKLPPDLIFLDVNLPDATGFQICGRFRSLPQTKTVPIIMMTGAARSTSQQSIGRQMGANDYILKPFNVDEVTAKVHALLGTIPPEYLKPEPDTTVDAASTLQTPETVSYPTVSPPAPWLTDTTNAPDTLPMFNFDALNLNVSPGFDSSSQAATALKKSDLAAFPDLMFEPPIISKGPTPALEVQAEVPLSVMPVKPLEEAPIDNVPFFKLKTEPEVEEKPIAFTDDVHTEEPEPVPPIEISEAPLFERLTEMHEPIAESPKLEPIPTLAEALKMLPKEEPPAFVSHVPETPVAVEPLPMHPPIIIHESKPEPEPQLESEPKPESEPELEPEPEPKPESEIERVPEFKTKRHSQPSLVFEPPEKIVHHTFEPSPMIEEPLAPLNVVEPVVEKREPISREEPHVERGPIGAFFFDSYRVGISLIALHMALVLGSELLADSTVTELVRGMALTIGGWALLLGLLTACTSFLGILLSSRMAVEILGLGAIPLVIKAAIGLYHEKTATLSFQQLIGNTSVLPPSTFWLRPLDLFQVATLVIMGIALTSKPGGTPRRSILTMALLAVLWSLFGRGYFRPF